MILKSYKKSYSFPSGYICSGRSMEPFDAVVCDIMEGDVLGCLDAFMDTHLKIFQTPKTDYSEFTTEQFRIFQRFCDILEKKVAESCMHRSVDPSLFMKACTDNLNVSEAVNTFAKILLISTEFQLFDDVMRDYEKRRYMFKIWRDWGNMLALSLGRK